MAWPQPLPVALINTRYQSVPIAEEGGVYAAVVEPVPVAFV